MSNLEEISPELFIWELYDGSALGYLDPYDLAKYSIGYCDGGRLPVRPKSGECALMIEYPDGERCWFHVDSRMIQSINWRRARMI